MIPPRRKRRRQQAVWRTIFLATNGRVTEYAYLSQLYRRVGHGGILAQVKVIRGDPLTVVKELSGSRSNLDSYREMWVVVDHDDQDRYDFLAKCRRLSSKRTAVHGIVSALCFEVWFNAHYTHAKSYRNQADAQPHYLELVRSSRKNVKTLPDNFPWDKATQAATRCHLSTDSLPETDT